MSPLLSSMFWSAILWSFADFMAQKLENRQKAVLPPYDIKRTTRLAIYAALWFAPTTTLWFDFLEHTFPGNTTRAALERVAMDQTINAVVSSVSLFVITGLLEGKGWPDIWRKLQHDLWPTLKAGWVVWPVVQFVNMAFVPLHERILVANIVNIPWCCYLAMKVAGAPTTADAVGGKDKDGVTVVVDSDHSGAGGGAASTAPLKGDESRP